MLTKCEDADLSADICKAASVIANTIGGLIEAMGMHAENQNRLRKGKSIIYTDVAFMAVVDERGLSVKAIKESLKSEGSQGRRAASNSC